MNVKLSIWQKINYYLNAPFFTVEIVTNFLDLIAFFLVTPQIIEEESWDSFTLFVRRQYRRIDLLISPIHGWKRKSLIVPKIAFILIGVAAPGYLVTHPEANLRNLIISLIALVFSGMLLFSSFLEDFLIQKGPKEQKRLMLMNACFLFVLSRLISIIHGYYTLNP